ncbi:MAG: AgmX/PglI C-terminal domain-containing protein [Myxococcota bacterium]
MKQAWIGVWLVTAIGVAHGQRSPSAAGPRVLIARLQGDHSEAARTAVAQAMLAVQDELLACVGTERESVSVQLRAAGGRITTAHAEMEAAEGPDPSRCVTRALEGVAMPNEVGDRFHVVLIAFASSPFAGLGLQAGSMGTAEGTHRANAARAEADREEGTDPPARRRARVRIGRFEVRGSLRSVVIRRALRRRVPALRDCYERELESERDRSGRIVARFTINAEGGVESADVTNVEGEFGGAPECIARVLERVRFPRPPDEEAVVVAFPIRLSTSGR